MKLLLQWGEGPEESAVCVCVCVCTFCGLYIVCSVANRFCEIKKLLLTLLKHLWLLYNYATSHPT